MDLRAPFPYFGGKSRAAPLVWERFGRCVNYVEPFFGSGAVLLACPDAQRPRVETVNDANCFLANFWRATRHDPETVANHADWPVNECVPAGTMIATPEGDVPVERITAGMVVWGFDGAHVVPTVVTATKQSTTSAALVRVGPLSLTSNHPVWTDAGYIEAGSLRQGMIVGIMVYDDHGSELGDLRSCGPEDGRGPLCRSHSPGLRASTCGAPEPRPEGREDASRLLDPLTVERGSVPDDGSDRGGQRGWLAVGGEEVDRASCSVGGQSHGGRGRDAGVHSEPGDAGEVVGAAAGRAVCAGSRRRHEGADAHPGGASQDRSGEHGPRAFTRSEGQALEGAHGQETVTGTPRVSGKAAHRDEAHRRAQGEDRGGDHDPEAGCLRRHGGSLRVDHRRLSGSGGVGSVGLSGAPEGVSLQGAESAPGVARAVYNFQTGTANYFAAGVLVHNCDLHARHRDLLRRGPVLRALLEDPHAFDVEAAGWWVWGASAWIGSGWCEEGRKVGRPLPELVGCNGGDGHGGTKHGKGIHAAGMREPSRQLPDMGAKGAKGSPQEATGRGIHAAGARGPSRQLPDLAGDGAGTQIGHGIHGKANRTRLFDIFAALSERLRYTRVACGDWSRICTPAVTYRHGLTAVFLDPPYDGFESLYGATEEGEPLSARVRAWALENGARPDMRIALAGYEGEHDALTAAGWQIVAWKAKGGYSNQGTGNENAKRERIWFSPACLKPGVNVGQIGLFARTA